MENIESEAKIKNRNEEKSFKQEGKYTELFNLKVYRYCWINSCKQKARTPFTRI